MPLTSRVKFMVLLVSLSLLVIGLATTVPKTSAREGDPPRVVGPVNTRRTVREGARVFRLHCPVESDTDLLVQWRKDGELIGPAWERFRFGNQQRTLRIKNAMVEDTGRYSCEAVNGFGRQLVDFTLIVYGKDDDLPGSFEYSPNEKNVAPRWVNPSAIKRFTSNPIVTSIGASQSFNCAASAEPRPQISWFRDGRPFRTYDTRNRFTIELKRLTLGDSATYSCRLINAFGALNATFRLKVVQRDRVPPEFDDSPSDPLTNSTVLQGRTATFQCKVKSASTPHIKWLKLVEEGTVVTDNSSLFQAHGMNLMVLDKHPSETLRRPNNTFLNQLELPNVQPASAGWYICVVASPSGHMVYRKAHLKVVSDPNSTPITEAITPTHLFIGVPLALLLVVLVGYAIYFLRRNQQKPLNKTVGHGSLLPPPPSRPPPQLPVGANNANTYKGTPSPRHSSTNYIRPEQRQLMTPSSAYYTRSPGVHSHLDSAVSGAAAYHHLEPQFAQNGVNYPPHMHLQQQQRGIYEQTPQPPYSGMGGWESEEEEEDEDPNYPSGGRLQPYPSLYSCA